MKSSKSFRFSSLLFFFIIVSMAVYSEADKCSYELIVQTGDRPDAGTNSFISVKLGNSAGELVEIPDLKYTGIMPSGHDYFENGKRDLFEVGKPCFENGPVCNITVTSDGSGPNPSWYLGDVEVIQNHVDPRTNEKFNFNQWLAKDEPPYELTASVNYCE